MPPSRPILWTFGLTAWLGIGWPLVQSLSPIPLRWLTALQIDYRFLQLSWQLHPLTGIPGWEVGLWLPLVGLIGLAGGLIWWQMKYNHKSL